MYLLAVLFPASPSSSRHHIGNLSQVVKGAGKGGGFIYPFVLSLSPNKSVPFVVDFIFSG